MSGLSSVKILVVLESWGTGGTETYVSGMVRFLFDYGYDVYIKLLTGDGAKNLSFLPEDKVFSDKYSYKDCLFLVKPNLVSMHLYTSLLPVVLKTRARHIPIVSTLHMPLLSWGMRHRAGWWLASLLSNQVVGVSPLVSAQISMKHLHPQPISGGVASEFFECAKYNNSESSAFQIMALGRHAREKDWITLVKAVALLKDKVDKLIVIQFCGDGLLTNELKEACEKLKVKAFFNGYVDKSTAVKILAYCDLSVLPSRFEGLGLSALETMAAGVPTITSDFSAAQAFIKEGETGSFFPAGDAVALAKKIKLYLESPEISKVVGNIGSKFVKENFSESVSYEDYVNVFNKALS